MISSPHNPKLKLVRSLQRRPKERQTANAFVADGVRLVEDAWVAGMRFRFVLHAEKLSKRGNKLIEGLRADGFDVEEIPTRLMQALSDTESAQGILAVVEFPGTSLPVSPTFILIPDQLRDPGNLGTLLRTAAAAGVDAVIIPPETTDPFAPKVVRAGMGAHFRIPILSLAWEEITAYIGLHSLAVFLADSSGSPCWQVDFRPALALIIGGEADGASSQVRSLSKNVVGIPMPGQVESLNAATAGSILMFEVLRQRWEFARK
ncbi:MAG: RNA methyltransferase [Chloroflexota bacterium]